MIAKREEEAFPRKNGWEGKGAEGKPVRKDREME